MKLTFTFILLFIFIVLVAQCESIEIDRTNWVVHSYSTEEANGEGPNNGRAIHAIDGNEDSFWHSRWQNYTNSFPHFLAFDLGEVHPVNGISVRSRGDSPNNKVKDYQVFLSLDGENWDPIQAQGTFEYENLNQSGEVTTISFGAVNAQFIKLVIDSNYDNNVHCAISEFKAFEISGGDECTATGQNNQILNLQPIGQHYATDANFAINASSNTDNPIQYQIIAGPATIDGNIISLTGDGGTVVVKATQQASDDYYMAEVFQSFEVINLATILPELHTNLTENYPLEMPQLYAYKITASASIAEPEALSIQTIEFWVNGEQLTTEMGSNSYFAWWTPQDYGSYNIEIKAIASNAMQLSDSYEIEVTNQIESREVITLQNAVIDWGSMGSQWFYGTYEMPQFVGAYDQIMAEFSVTCPDVAGGCDDWDRLGYLQIKNPDGEWIELIRYITPYGVACNHELDVTDYANLLQGKVEYRMYIETWGTGGWEMELILHYNQGTPAYVYSEIEEVWQGTYNFGDMANLQPVPQVAVTAPLSTEEATFRVVTTGHGWGQNNTGNAAEFYYAEHNFNINGNNTFAQDLRVDCNPNPDGCTGQQGTWYYDRAGWCPGTIAKPYIYNITPYINAPYNFDYEFETDYRDYCHPNNPDCVSGTTCPDCNDGYNPHYRIAAYNVYKSNSPLGTLATQEVTNQVDNQLSVFPNPSNGIFRVQLKEEMTNTMVQIYNAQGEYLKKYAFKNRLELENFTFNVNDLPKGIYFIKIYNQKQMTSSKLLLK